MFKVDNYRVYFKHFPTDEGILSVEIEDGRALPEIAFKGFTKCFIVDDSTEEVLGYGESFCSVNDVFYKPTGRKVALTRALEGLDKDFRTKIWQAYREASVK